MTIHILTLKMEEKPCPPLMEVECMDLRFEVHQALSE
jgi:hypothetical protein